ncbi:MAG: hypothetical protein ACJ77E_09300 [Gaiellaceae bacterium]
MIRSALLAAVLVLALTACGAQRQSSGATRTIADLHDIGQLRSAFDTASGEPRLIVIVSPT